MKFTSGSIPDMRHGAAVLAAAILTVAMLEFAAPARAAEGQTTAETPTRECRDASVRAKSIVGHPGKSVPRVARERKVEGCERQVAKTEHKDA